MQYLHIGELLSLGLIALVIVLGYLLLGLFLLAVRQHQYPAWLDYFGSHHGFMPFFLHWLLWPVCLLVIWIHQHRINLARRRSLL